MTKAEGTCKIDAVEVGELAFVQIGSPTPVLTVKYALANAHSGDRYGSAHRNQGWSQQTLERLTALLESIEADLIVDLFGEGTTRSVVEPPADTSDGVPSL